MQLSFGSWCSERRSAWQGPWQERFDANHLSMPAMGAVTQRHASEALIAVAAVLNIDLTHHHWRWCRQQVPALAQSDLPIAVGQQPVVTDSLESRWQNMQQEATNELVCVQAHAFVARLVAVVLPGERDSSVAELAQAVVGDRYPMGVTTKIFQHLFGATERRLGVDHPRGTRRRRQMFGKGNAIAQRLKAIENCSSP